MNSFPLLNQTLHYTIHYPLHNGPDILAAGVGEEAVLNGHLTDRLVQAVPQLYSPPAGRHLRSELSKTLQLINLRGYLTLFVNGNGFMLS